MKELEEDRSRDRGLMLDGERLPLQMPTPTLRSNHHGEVMPIEQTAELYRATDGMVLEYAGTDDDGS
jgi:hypothetical protein